MTGSTHEKVHIEALNNEDNASSCETGNATSTAVSVVEAEVFDYDDSSSLLDPSFNSQLFTASHVAQNKPSFICDNCYVDFGSEEALEDHEKMYQYGCDVCSLCYKTILEAENHDLEKHPTLDDGL